MDEYVSIIKYLDSDILLPQKYTGVTTTDSNKYFYIYGINIFIDDEIYFLTCYRYIKNKNNLKIYKILKELDLALIDFKNNKKIITFDDYMKDDIYFSKISNNTIYIINNINTVESNIFEIFYDNINTTHIPKLPLIKIYINNYSDFIFNGGDLVYQDNKIVGIVSYNKDNNLYCIPFYLIYYMLKSNCPVHNNIIRLLNYDIPSVDIKLLKEDYEELDDDYNAKIVNYSNNIYFNTNDIILSVDNNKFNDNNMIYFNIFDTYISFELYIFLKACYCKNINIYYYKYDEYNDDHNILNYVLKDPIDNEIYRNIIAFDENNNFKLSCIVFDELSEEYLINMFKNDIVFTDKYYYDTINRNNKKYIFIKKVEYSGLDKYEDIDLARKLIKLNAPYVECDDKYKLLILNSINNIVIKDINEIKYISNISSIQLKYLDSDEYIEILTSNKN